MKAEFTLKGDRVLEPQLVIKTSPHPTAGNLQMTLVTIGTRNGVGWEKDHKSFNLGMDERKALAAFLLSIPDDQP